MQHREENEIDPIAQDSTAPASSARDGASASADAASPDATGASELDAPDTGRRLAEQQERYLRLAAEYDNFRKRTGRERAEAYARAQADLVRQLLDSLDDLARFAHVDPETVDAKTIGQGVEMVEKKMMKALSTAGLQIVDPVNQSFDPTLHEAVSTEPALSPEDDHVVSRVFQSGYLFNGQLLRPARVVVKQWNG